MRNRNFKILLIISLLACHAPAFAINSPKYLSWDGFAVVEDVDNFKANVRRGNVVDLVGQIIAKIDTQKANLWQNGEFDFGLLGVYVTNNQYKFSAMLQPPSNYYSPNSEIRISNLSYQHTWRNKIQFIAGIMDMNNYFDVTESATYFLNDSFTNTPALIVNTVAATYPYPGFGAVLNVPTKYVNFLGGIFQGNPKEQHTVFYKGYMLLGELSSHINIEPGTNVDYLFKVGAWHYQQPDHTIGHTNNGMYVLGQRMWKNGDNQARNVFVQGGFSPTIENIGQYSLGVGFNVFSVFPNRPHDVLSVGYTQLWVRHHFPEVVWEFGYTIMLCKHLYLVPDLQFAYHPSGIVNRPSFVGLLRLKYSLSDLFTGAQNVYEPR